MNRLLQCNHHMKQYIRKFEVFPTYTTIKYTCLYRNYLFLLLQKFKYIYHSIGLRHFLFRIDNLITVWVIEGTLNYILTSNNWYKITNDLWIGYIKQQFGITSNWSLYDVVIETWAAGQCQMVFQSNIMVFFF